MIAKMTSRKHKACNSEREKLRAEVKKLQEMYDNKCRQLKDNDRMWSRHAESTYKLNEKVTEEHMKYDALRQTIFYWLFSAYAEYTKCHSKHAETYQDIYDWYIAKGKLIEILALAGNAGLIDTFLSWLEIGRNVPNTMYKYKTELTKVLLAMREKSKRKEQDET